MNMEVDRFLLKTNQEIMMSKLQTIKIDDVEYVRKDSIETPTMDGKPYVIIRTYSAGVHAGYLEFRVGQEVILLNSRRLWYWDGAASLSQLSVDGVSKPDNCKFTVEVARIELLQAIEILPCTDKAKKCIESVKVWKS